MKLISLRVQGYRQFLESTALEFPEGLTGICGPNGVGKSKLVEAIGYALYGPNDTYILPKGDRAADIPSVADPGCAQKVELTFELRRQRYDVVRTPSQVSIKMQGADTPLAEGSREVGRAVTRLLRLGPAGYSGTFVARQNQVAGLQSYERQDRRQLVNGLLGISVIEKALKDCHKECTTRAAVYKAQVDNDGISVGEATAELERRQAHQRNVEKAHGDVVRERVAADKAYNTSLETWNGLLQDAGRADALRAQLEELASHRSTLEDIRRSALERAATASRATEAIRSAERVLEERDSVDALLAHLDIMEHVATLRRQRDDNERRLTEEIGPRRRALDRLQGEIEKIDGEIETLNRELRERTAERSAGDHAMKTERQRANASERLREKALELGPDGHCETCGQAFGDNLEYALRHHEEEAAAARLREAEAKARYDLAQNQIEGIQGRIKDLDARRNEYKKENSKYDTVPGEEAHLSKDLKRINRELADIGAPITEQAYDETAHAEARAARARIEQAEAEIERLRPQAALKKGAESDARNADGRLAVLAQQERTLDEELALLKDAEESAVRAEEKVGAAKATLEKIIERERTAYQDVSDARAQVTTAELELGRAKERERNQAAAHRALLVAQRTEAILGQMLTAIIHEARPYLCELMGGWARAMMGSRWKIGLTEDYRIEANNGSNKHQIEHFSGGEQTLLAVMLRVAISIFCRQRAGYDTGFLILDEIFGNQDSERRALLVQFLEEIKLHYHQIIVVNHVEDVTDMLGSIIDVEPTGANTSRARFRM